MHKIVNNKNYVNKDFNAIYTELLDIVKELSPRWDPTVSNESDPGVLLLKADALIADKNNYNIDKNILEVFPETVTQEYNARNLYKQLGYSVPWYRSATGTVSIQWLDENTLTDAVTIDKFSMITDVENKLVYTLLEDIVLSPEEPVATGQIIEGSFVEQSVNGTKVIVVEDMDKENRIYLDDYLVAENGIFVYSVGNNLRWEQVDNILHKPAGSYVYEFGVDIRNQVCYLKFPDDISSLIGNGLNISYVTSSGEEGNTTAKTLDRFYTQMTVELSSGSVSLDSNVVKLYNTSECINGTNPPSISAMYESYKKVAGTFDTYVTARDYANALYNTGLVSNAIVSDRLTDVQSSYNVVTADTVNTVDTYVHKVFSGDIRMTKTYVVAGESYPEGVNACYKKSDNNYVKVTTKTAEESGEVYIEEGVEEDSMNAFDLRAYLFQHAGTVATLQQYNDSFELLPQSSNRYKEAVNLLESSKCVQHNFKEYMIDVPVMFKNVYPLHIKIIPQYKIGDNEQTQVQRSILEALRKHCNSRNIEFGAEPDYNEIYDVISSSDDRIKAVMMSDFTYTTMAVYWTDLSDGNKGFKEIPISDSETPLCVKIADGNGITYINGTLRDKYKNDRMESVWKTAYFIYQDDSRRTIVAKYNENTDKVEEYSTLLDNFRRDIITKSILAGKTPLFYIDDAFDTAIYQQYINQKTTDRLTTFLAINPFAKLNGSVSGGTTISVLDPYKPNAKADTWNYYKEATINGINVEANDSNVSTSSYTLKENESIRCFGPSFIDGLNYSNYTKFEFVMRNPLTTKRNWESMETGPEGGSLYYIYPDVNEGNSALGNFIIDIVKLVTDSGNFIDVSAEDYGNSVELQAIQDFVKNHVWLKLKGTNNSTTEFKNSEQQLFKVEEYDNKKFSCNCASDCYQFEYTDVSGADFSGTYDLSALFNICINAEVTEQNTQNNGLYNRYKNVFTQDTDPIKLTSLRPYGNKGTPEAKLYIQYVDSYKGYSINANTDYQLRKDDYIAFFWRGEGDDTTPYNYNYYRGKSTIDSTIIRPSFQLRGVPPQFAKINTSAFAENVTGVIPYSSNTNSNFSRISNFYGSNDLSSSNQIVIRKLNEVKLKDTESIYFITNCTQIVNKGDQEVKQYLLVFDHYNETSARLEYILKSDEYFFRFFGKDKQSFEMLGPGTAIYLYLDNKLDSAPVENSVFVVLSCEVEENTTNIFQNSGESFRSKLCPIKPLIGTNIKYISSETSTVEDTTAVSIANIAVREQTMFNFVEGDTITFNRNDARDDSFVIRSDKVVVLPETWNIQYTTKGSTSYTSLSPVVLTDGSGWNMMATLNLETAKGIPQKVVGYTANNTDGNCYMSIQAILWKSSPSNTDSTLQTDSTTKWTFVNLSETETTISEEAVTQPYYLQSDVVLQKVGGSNIDVTYVDGLGDVKEPQFYVYHEANYNVGALTRSGNNVYFDFSLSNDQGVTDSSWVRVNNEYTCKTPKLILPDNATYLMSLRHTNGYSDYRVYLTPTMPFVNDEGNWQIGETDTQLPYNTQHVSSEAMLEDKDEDCWMFVFYTTYHYEEDASLEYNEGTGTWCIGDVDTGIRYDTTDETRETDDGTLVILKHTSYKADGRVEVSPLNQHTNSDIKYYSICPNDLLATNEFYLIIAHEYSEEFLQEPGKLWIEGFTKYNEGTNVFNLYEKYPNVSFKEVIGKIQELDYDGLFKYDYYVPSEQRIKDPLDAISFLDENHIFNKYTLPKALCSIPTTESESTIEFLNNR